MATSPYPKMTTFLSRFALMLVLMVQTMEASALKCGKQTRTFQQYYEDADFVFVGVIYRIEAPLDPPRTEQYTGRTNPMLVIAEGNEAKVFEKMFGPYTADFAVFELLKGDKELIPSIQFSGYAGDLRPEIGMGYLIFADRAGHTGACWGSEESTSYMMAHSKERTSARTEAARLRNHGANGPTSQVP